MAAKDARVINEQPSLARSTAWGQLARHGFYWRGLDTERPCVAATGRRSDLDSSSARGDVGYGDAVDGSNPRVTLAGEDYWRRKEIAESMGTLAFNLQAATPVFERFRVVLAATTMDRAPASEDRPRGQSPAKSHTNCTADAARRGP